MPQTSRAEIKQDVLTKISELSGEDILLLEVAVAIAEAESGFVENATNSLSSATGIFQFLIGTWYHYECDGTRWNYEDNVSCALRVMSNVGFSDWEASRWGKYGWWDRLSDEAKTYVKFFNTKPEPVKVKKISFAGGLVLIDFKGNILHNGKIWNGKGEIPHI